MQVLPQILEFIAQKCPNLRKVSLSNCVNATNRALADLSRLTNLTTLNLNNCQKLTGYPSSTWPMQMYQTYFSFPADEGLQYLPPSLVRLCLSNCSNISLGANMIPGHVKYLDLSNTPTLSRELDHLPRSLVSLNLEGCCSPHLGMTGFVIGNVLPAAERFKHVSLRNLPSSLQALKLSHLVATSELKNLCERPTLTNLSMKDRRNCFLDSRQAIRSIGLFFEIESIRILDMSFTDISNLKVEPIFFFATITTTNSHPYSY